MNEFPNIGKIGSCQANPRPCRVNAGRSRNYRGCSKTQVLGLMVATRGPGEALCGVADGAKRMEWIGQGSDCFRQRR